MMVKSNMVRILLVVGLVVMMVVCWCNGWWLKVCLCFCGVIGLLCLFSMCI